MEFTWTDLEGAFIPVLRKKGGNIYEVLLGSGDMVVCLRFRVWKLIRILISPRSLRW